MRGKGFLLVLVLGLVSFIFGATSSFGSGFALYEGSARGNSLGGAMAARADDPSAIFYNPAGLTQVGGLQVLAGATAIMPSTDVVIGGTSFGTEDNVWVPPHLYASYQFSDRVWFGLGAFSQFGLGVEFDPEWPGRFNNIKTTIETITVNPTVAVKLSDSFSAAAGIDVMWFNLNMKRALPIPVGPYVFEQRMKLEGDSFGYGFNVGLHYKPTDWIAAGISYRSPVKQNVEGDAKFTPGNSMSPDMSSALNSDVEGSIKLPDTLFAGVMVKPMKQLSLEAGIIWTHWSNFDRLTMKFDSPLGVLSEPKDWSDTMRYVFGVEYKVNPWLDLRAGYVFDEEAIPDEHVDYIVPANDRHYFNFGPGFRWGKWVADVSYTYLRIEERTVDKSRALGVFPSKFEDGNAHMVGLSIGYAF